MKGMKRASLLAVAAGAVYVVTVVLGGLLWPEYSHLKQAISELTFGGAPNRGLMLALFSLYNSLLLLFAIRYFIRAKSRLLKLSAASLVLCAVAGIAMLVWPQDPLNTPLTFSGLLHLIFAGIAALTTLLAVLFVAIEYRKRDTFISVISYVVFVGILLAGPFTAAAPAMIPEYFGLAERVPIGLFVSWLLLFGWRLHAYTSRAPA